jgi:diguanylate cyclase (GGDEF)-like protein/PAS domain S-box-containing protein
MDDRKIPKARLVEEIKALREEVRLGTERLRDSMIQAGIVASSMDAIIIIDEEQNIVQFNTAAEAVFGYPVAEVRGKPIHMLLPDRHRAGHQQHIRNFLETGSTSRTMQSLGALHGMRADGQVFPIEASIARTEVGQGKFLGVIIRDISERENYESLIMRQYDSLNTLHLITLDLLNHRDIKDLLQFIVDQSVKLLEVSYCEILLPEGDALVAQAFTRNSPFAGGNRFTRDQAQLSWRVFDTGLPVVVDDYSAWPHRQDIYEAESFHAAAGLPLLAGGQPIGVMGLTRDKPGYRFTEEQILTATRLAAIAALAIENSRLLLEVQRLATIDELTGVHNRRSLIDLGERELQRAIRHGRSLSVLMLDVDHFKQVNDTWGHQAGDVVLRAVAQEAVKQLRRSDTIGRYADISAGADNVVGRFGGEEFAVLLPESTLDGALAAAERIRLAIEAINFQQADQTAAPDIRVTVSLGAACLNSKTDSLTEVLARADQALYLAKQAGRNRVCKVP